MSPFPIKQILYVKYHMKNAAIDKLIKVILKLNNSRNLFINMLIKCGNPY